MNNRNATLIAIGAMVVILAAFLAYQFIYPPIPEPTIPPVPESVAPPATVPTPPSPPIEPVAEVPKPRIIQDRFVGLLAQNEDAVGWIQISNTKVDYPVAKSVNNDYYLHRDLNRKKSYAGTLFMDYRNKGDPLDRHSIIYGHNMKDGTMFGTLRLFKKKAFFDANRFFTYSTLYEDIQWEIFSAYIAPAKLDLIQTNFVNDDEFMRFITAEQSKSTFPTDVVLKPTDRILTLITCTYEIPDARYVIRARMIEK